MDNSNAKRGGHYMDLLDHYFRPDGVSVCGIYDSKKMGSKRNRLNKPKLKEALSRGGGRPLCFGCEKVMAPKAEK